MARVDIWEWSLDLSGPALDRLAGHLSPDEAARAARFVNPLHGRRHIAARGRLREILGGICGVAPAALRFAYGPQGKPALQGGPAFNLTHSADRAMLAVCDGPELGIDLEAWREVEPAVARRYFTPAEQAELASLDFTLGFFRCWTRKEATVKAVGQGLSMPLTDFDVTLGPSPRMARMAGGAEGWHLVDLAPGRGWSAALAMRDPSGPPTILRQLD